MWGAADPAHRGGDIGLRGLLADDCVTYGHSVTATAIVEVSRAYGLRTQVEGIVAEARQGATENAVYTRLKLALSVRLP